MENSIELFNCPLCSFCETGLDRLVTHIRQHIKPEPKCTVSSSSTTESDKGESQDPVMQREQPMEQKERHLDNCINNLSVARESPKTISLFTSESSSNDIQMPSISSEVTTRPASTSSNYQDIQKGTQQPPLNLEVNQQSQPQSIQPIQISPPLLQPPPQHSMIYLHKDAPKYVQIHPREHFNNNPQYPHPPQQFIAQTSFVNAGEQYVPIAPANEIFHRGGAGIHHQNHQQTFVASPHHRGLVPIKGHHPEIHGSFSAHQAAHSQQQKFNSPPQRQQNTGMQYHYQQQRSTAVDHHLQSRVQSRVSNVQNVDLPNVGFPNNGTLLLNPEQLLKMSGNTTSLDQLAGLLVIPLKKTSEIAIQTDPVEFGSNKAALGNVSSAVQTDLRMQYISEEPRLSPTSIFGQIRSTDALWECLICGEDFQSDQYLQSHVSSVHMHVCGNCFHASSNLQEHNSHLAECGKCDTELLCMDCNSLFASVKSLNQHRITIHSVQMQFRCGVCNQPFETQDAVTDHMTSHSNGMPQFNCQHCLKVFQSENALSKHVQRHKMVDVEYECKFCWMPFKTDQLLREHVNVTHMGKEPGYNNGTQSGSDTQHQNTTPVQTTPIQSSTNKKYLICRYCDLAFKNKELLSRHVKICSKNGTLDVTCFVCDVCKEFFDSDNSRKQHLKNDHRRQNGYRCPKCSKVYRTWTRLKFHTKQQHLKKSCTDCGLVFTKEHVLRKHQEDVHGKTTTQNGDRIYKCSDCNLSMYTLTDLTMHRRTLHPESKSSKTADQSSNATMLSILDNPNKENSITDKSMLDQQDSLGNAKENGAHTCERCNATFDDEKRLKNHLGLTHGERPFICKICSKRFQYSSQIVWHMKNHTTRPITTLVKTNNSVWKAKTTLTSKLKPRSSLGSTNHVCQFCGARFKQEKLLKNHKGVAHKIKLFSCFICASKFGHSTELIWHVRACKAKFIRENPGTALPPENNAEQQLEQPLEDVSMDDINSINESNDQSMEYEQQLNFPSNEGVDDLEMPGTNIQLSKEEAEELLQNDPEYDQSRGEYTCPLCKKTTKSITGMKTHYGRVHGIWGKESSHKFANGHKVTIWPCRNCESEFKSFDEIQAHCLELHGLTVSREDLDFEARTEFVKNPPEPSLYTCKSCGMSFDNSKSIRVHTFKKHGILLNDVSLNESRNDDADPSTVYTSASKQKANALTTNDMTDDDLRYKCPRCKSQFRTTKALRVHSYKRHGVILSKLEINQNKKLVATDIVEQDHSSSSSSSAQNPNKGRDLVESPNPCDRCGRVFGNYRALFTHYRQAHRITDPSHVFVPKKPSRTELSIQNFSPSNETSESQVPQQKQGPEVADSVDCPKCSRVFTNHKSFVAHLYSAHKVSKDQYSIYWPNGIPILPRESSMCPTCDKECLDERAMRIHMFKAHGTHYRDYAAGDKESKSGALGTTEGMVTMVNEPSIDQMTVETKNDAFICNVCNRVCKNNRSLISHEFNAHGIRWENGKRTLPSELKNKQERKSSLLNENESASMINDDSWVSSATASTPVEKQFVCTLCSASYHNKRAITTHLCRVHKYKRDDVQAYFSNISSGASMVNSFLDNSTESPLPLKPLANDYNHMKNDVVRGNNDTENCEDLTKYDDSGEDHVPNGNANLSDKVDGDGDYESFFDDDDEVKETVKDYCLTIDDNNVKEEGDSEFVPSIDGQRKDDVEELNEEPDFQPLPEHHGKTGFNNEIHQNNSFQLEPQPIPINI